MTRKYTKKVNSGYANFTEESINNALQCYVRRELPLPIILFIRAFDALPLFLVAEFYWFSTHGLLLPQQCSVR